MYLRAMDLPEARRRRALSAAQEAFDMGEVFSVGLVAAGAVLAVVGFLGALGVFG